MEIRYLNKNRTYTNPTTIRPEYVVVHSTAAGLRSRFALYDAWNVKSADKSCHGMVDDTGCMLTLPPTFRAWHVGSLGNGVSVGFEIAEPYSIAYKDKYHGTVDTLKYDPQNADVRSDFLRRWRYAAEMAAYLCRETGIDAEHVLCHAEMSRIGKATAHGDVLHWWPLFGPEYSMDRFRAEVDGRLRGLSAGGSAASSSAGSAAGNATGTSASAPTGAPPYRVRRSWEDAASQIGAYNVLANAQAAARAHPGFAVFDRDGKKVE